MFKINRRQTVYYMPVNDPPGPSSAGYMPIFPAQFACHILIAGTAGWLILKSKRWFFLGCMGLSGFVICHAFNHDVLLTAASHLSFITSAVNGDRFRIGQQCRFGGDASLRRMKTRKIPILCPAPGFRYKKRKNHWLALNKRANCSRFREERYTYLTRNAGSDRVAEDQHRYSADRRKPEHQDA